MTPRVATLTVLAQVTQAVHEQGSFIFCQLGSVGRAALRGVLPRQYDIVSSGDISLSETASQGGDNKPRPLTEAEIEGYVDSHVEAARNAMLAGFDGVEVHSANGYLLDQFLQTNADNRTDAYGGSAANRIRFTARVVQAIAETIGADRTALRLSPYERSKGVPHHIVADYRLTALFVL